MVYAADHPQRKQYWVGSSTVGTILGQRIAPALLDRYLARTSYSSQQTGQLANPDRPHNLWGPVDGAEGHDHGAHEEFDELAQHHDPQLFLSHHPRWLVSVVAQAPQPFQRDRQPAVTSAVSARAQCPRSFRLLGAAQSAPCASATGRAGRP